MLTNEELNELNNIREQIDALRLRHESIVEAAANRSSNKEQTEASSSAPVPSVVGNPVSVHSNDNGQSTNDSSVSIPSNSTEPYTKPKKPCFKLKTLEEIEIEIVEGSKGTQYWHADREEAPLELPTHIPLRSALELMTNSCCGD